MLLAGEGGIFELAHRQPLGCLRAPARPRCHPQSTEHVKHPPPQPPAAATVSQSSPTTIGQRIAALRAQANPPLTQGDLAQRLGCEGESYAWISRIESGQDTRLSTLRRIATALGVDLDELILGKQNGGK